jgi:hypothetical protein
MLVRQYRFAENDFPREFIKANDITLKAKKAQGFAL